MLNSCSIDPSTAKVAQYLSHNYKRHVTRRVKCQIFTCCVMFVVVMETIMDIGVFLDVTPCSLEKTNRFLEELAARILYYKYRNSRL
jgi:hypothetical protein